MIVKSSVIVTGILCLMVATIADDNNTSKFTRLVCAAYDKTLIVFTTCSLRVISRNYSVITVQGKNARPLHSILVHVQMFKKYTTYKPFLINRTENFCHFFSKKSSTPYVKLIYSLANQYTSLNHSCPYEKGEVIFKDLPLDASKLRSLWPAGEYRLDVSVLLNGGPKPASGGQVFFEIGEKLFG